MHLGSNIPQSGGPDFMVEGIPARNRAFQGDLVVVKLLDEVHAAKVFEVCAIKGKCLL